MVGKGIACSSNTYMSMMAENDSCRKDVGTALTFGTFGAVLMKGTTQEDLASDDV